MKAPLRERYLFHGFRLRKASSASRITSVSDTSCASQYASSHSLESTVSRRPPNRMGNFEMRARRFVLRLVGFMRTIVDDLQTYVKKRTQESLRQKSKRPCLTFAKGPLKLVVRATWKPSHAFTRKSSRGLQAPTRALFELSRSAGFARQRRETKCEAGYSPIPEAKASSPTGEDHRQNVIDGRLRGETGVVILKARRRMTPIVRARELNRTGLSGSTQALIGTCARVRETPKNDQGRTQNVPQPCCWDGSNRSYLIPSTQDGPDTSRGSLRAVMPSEGTPMCARVSSCISIPTAYARSYILAR